MSSLVEDSRGFIKRCTGAGLVVGFVVGLAAEVIMKSKSDAK